MLSERSAPSMPPLPHSPYLGARSKGMTPPISYVLPLTYLLGESSLRLTEAVSTGETERQYTLETEKVHFVTFRTSAK